MSAEGCAAALLSMAAEHQAGALASMSKEDLEAALAAMSDEDRAALTLPMNMVEKDGDDCDSYGNYDATATQKRQFANLHVGIKQRHFEAP